VYVTLWDGNRTGSANIKEIVQFLAEIIPKMLAQRK